MSDEEEVDQGNDDEDSTMDTICEELLWSFDCLKKGLWPTHDRNHKLLTIMYQNNVKI